MELYKKYRPTLLKQIVGQDEIVKQLTGKLKSGNLPHFLLFTGPSGCGKTTLAKILKKKLKCSDHDFVEINASDMRGIDTIREIKSRVNLAPMGNCRIWLIDECHQQTSQAQESFLKLLEDTPSHVYFFLCTTEPEKLIKAIRTRATEIKVNALSDLDAKSLMLSICEKENKKVSEEVCEKIAEVSEGSARKALVILDQILELDNEQEQLQSVQSIDLKPKVTELSKILINPKSTWKQVKALLNGLQDEEPESIRYMVLGYANSALLKGWGDPNRAYLMMEEFSSNFYDSKKYGVTLACYRVIHGD